MFFKFLNHDLTDQGYIYHTGLNTAKNPFDEYPGCNEGISFIDENNVYECPNYGTKIAKVVIPKQEKIIQKNGIILLLRQLKIFGQ